MFKTSRYATGCSLFVTICCCQTMQCYCGCGPFEMFKVCCTKIIRGCYMYFLRFVHEYVTWNVEPSEAANLHRLDAFIQPRNYLQRHNCVRYSFVHDWFMTTMRGQMPCMSLLSQLPPRHVTPLQSPCNHLIS